MSGGSEKNDSAFRELKDLLHKLPPEKRKRTLYVLDYVMNYFVGERRVPQLTSLGFGDELNRLKEIGIVNEVTRYWRGNTYTFLYIKEGLSEKIKELLEKEYYPLFVENKIAEEIAKIVKKSLAAASKLWHKVQEFETKEYVLSGYGEYDSEVNKLGEELAKNGLGYLIGYWSTSWAEYCTELVFRKDPINIREIFLKVVEEEINKVFTSFTPEMRWCLYLKHVKPDADADFMMRNRTARFLPAEIKKAFQSVPDLKIEKLEHILGTLIDKEKERLSSIIRNLINRDITSILCLSTLVLLGIDRDRYLEIDKWHQNEFEKTFTHLEKAMRTYIDIFKDYGIVLESNYGDIYIPKLSVEVFQEQMKGGAVEVKIFESQLDAQSFIEEKISKAVSTVKLWDPYVSTRTLRMIERSIKESEVTVEILSSQPIILEDIISLRKKGMKVKAKVIYKKKGEKYLSPFHDRYLIIDEVHVWHFGPSFHAVGEKEWESATLFPENLGKIITQAFAFNFTKKKEDWEKEGYEVVEIGAN